MMIEYDHVLKLVDIGEPALGQLPLDRQGLGQEGLVGAEADSF
jgi:hypothetical protein